MIDTDKGKSSYVHAARCFPPWHGPALVALLCMEGKVLLSSIPELAAQKRKNREGERA